MAFRSKGLKITEAIVFSLTLEYVSASSAHLQIFLIVDFCKIGQAWQYLLESFCQNWPGGVSLK